MEKSLRVETTMGPDGGLPNRKAKRGWPKQKQRTMGVRKRKTINISITLHRLQRTFMNAISRYPPDNSSRLANHVLRCVPVLQMRN